MGARRFWTIAVLPACSLFTASATVLYVDVNSTNPIVPYTNWSTATTVIQDAIDAASAGDEIMVTNGVYTTGGRVAASSLVTNRVLVDKSVTLRSANGASFTTILGYQVPGTIYGNQAIRAVYLTSGAVLDGFTVSNGACVPSFVISFEDYKGGGVYCASTSEMVANCVISGGFASKK